jgi:hypothetical protein
MDLLRKYLVPLYQAPDTAVDPAPSDPPTPPTAADSTAAAADAAADPQLPLDIPPTPTRSDKPFIDTITGLRAKTREIETENARLRQEAADARALAERLAKQNGGTAPAPVTTPAPAIAPAPFSDDADVDRRADYKLFLRDVNAMRSSGFQQFGPSFGENIKALDAVGAADDAFVSQVLAVDPANAHVLLHTLATDLEKTVSLVGMDPARRIAELTRLAMAATAPKTDATTTTVAPPAPPAAAGKAPPAKSAVSRAPAPPPPVEPNTSKTIDWRSDEASDEEFTRGFNETMAKRVARR